MSNDTTTIVGGTERLFLPSSEQRGSGTAKKKVSWPLGTIAAARAALPDHRGKEMGF
jgi:hypothetical protein